MEPLESMPCLPVRSPALHARGWPMEQDWELRGGGGGGGGGRGGGEGGGGGGGRGGGGG